MKDKDQKLIFETYQLGEIYDPNSPEGKRFPILTRRDYFTLSKAEADDLYAILIATKAAILKDTEMGGPRDQGLNWDQANQMGHDDVVYNHVYNAHKQIGDNYDMHQFVESLIDVMKATDDAHTHVLAILQELLDEITTPDSW